MLKNVRTLIIGTTTAVALGSVPASAAPVSGHTSALKAAALSNVVDVRWRGRHVGAGVAAGLAFGALAGAAIAASPRYYDPYYGVPAYGPAYGYAPVYDYGYGLGYDYDHGAYAYAPRDKDCVIRGAAGRRDYSQC